MQIILIVHIKTFRIYGKSINSNREAAKKALKFPDISNTNKFSWLALEDTVEVNDSNVSSQSSDDECSVYECKSNYHKRKTKRPLNSRVPRKQIKESHILHILTKRNAYFTSVPGVDIHSE